MIRPAVHSALKILRQSPLRRAILAGLVKTHNFSYHMTSFFASHEGVHPKHALINYHAFFLANVLSTDRVLDVGCGKGEVATSVAQKASQVVGIDFSAKSLKLANGRSSQANLSFILGDATTYDWQQDFDVVILSNVLEHIEQRPELLKKLSALAPKILIRVPMVTRDWITMYKREQGLEYLLDDTHFIEYDREAFKQEIEEAGLALDSLLVDFGEIYAVVSRPA